MPGRPRKPTALKKQAGTLQKCRTNPNEPQLPPELPPPPAGLSPEVVDAYVAHGQLVLDMRVMTRADSNSLVAWATCWVDWQRAVAQLESFKALNGGSEYYESDGNSGRQIKAHPALGVARAAERAYRNWCQSFGTTPSDRAKVAAVDKPAEKSKLAKVLELKKA